MGNRTENPTYFSDFVNILLLYFLVSHNLVAEIRPVQLTLIISKMVKYYGGTSSCFETTHRAIRIRVKELVRSGLQPERVFLFDRISTL